ncbi:MAG: hypothetical protein HN478_05560 [Rhodospirillaceae bacterium]|jgi:hypothetical protein|nr:hypothetical protein [Rhodospirillaceae bacterium]MBT4487156.1 hypothetical protein [Rhodospirillaceae bacterium]MBT5898071.1 hypothetical protein [Rhodospirillaceae bacterium]MBT6430284.1 hypothetical protein [Rhodospirillaceae bacterium]MBT7758668.1 hypothetical protein [Rhodospirillaceae bacterium]
MPRAQPTPNKAPRGKPGDFQEIQVPNKLLEKVGPGFGANPAAVERADNIVEQMKATYEARLEDELEDVIASYEAMCASGTFDLDKLHDAVHEIRGEAGTFGYNLVSDIGKLLCELLSPIATVSASDEQAINAHLKAMQTVVARQVKGAGPEVAKQIIQGLTAIVEKSRNGK